MHRKKKVTERVRLDNELPSAISEWGWKYHHIGIPTDKSFPGEEYISSFRLYHSGFETSPFGVEWMRFESNSPVNELIKTVPHIAFEVDNLELELEKHNFKIITPPNSPSEGARVAMIEHNGAPIELIEFRNR
ncbi:MAG TPA: hypothetical protein PLR88_08590 [Bacteroidales bacterium]|nr:hypothetical protein [Bacteroidales bacterium]